MALQSTTNIYIGGNEIATFKRFVLHQQLDSHHMLELVCRMDVLEDLSMNLGESSKNFLGETLTIQVSALDGFVGYKTLEFKGVVTQIKTIKGYEASSGDEIVIKAQSPTFLADDGPHYASYNDVSLSEILDKTFRDYDTSKLELLVQPNNDSSLHYSVQHNESAYDYASRLAAMYGEWFYYNGKQLVFGTPNTEELNLTYGFDLKEYNLSLLPQSHNYKYYATDYLQDEIHEKDAKDITAGTDGYNGFVSNKANAIYNKETKVWHNHYSDSQSKQRLDASIELQKKAIEIKQVQLNGVSDNPGVALGSIVVVEGGRYRVTKTTHTNSENGNYNNRFEAITAEFDAYPNTSINAFPKSETQTAIVVENSDPEGLGRIKVQFPWQRIVDETTPWIRIVLPHAGVDKGFHFVPEIGEEVLIGFEGGNAEHPYMLGSLYNGSEKPDSWKTDGNDIKAIRTRSGHTIEFNDTNGAESITIIDKNSNTIYIDSANNNIDISANETMTLSANNIKIKANENIDMVAGKDFTKSIAENYNVMTKNNTLIVEENLSTDAKKQVNVADEITLSSNKENLTLTSGKTVDVQSKEKVKLF